MGTSDAGAGSLIDCLDRAVASGDVHDITQRIKGQLEELCRTGALRIPDRMTECCSNSYARRLLHRNEELGYTVVVMTWGPGQGTQLHDHAGIWCVECVVEGQLQVTQYDLVEKNHERFRFDKVNCVHAGVGDAGCLIPPFEYHVLANALSDRRSVTLHVYGGEMDHCNLFTPQDEGWWQKTRRSLSYDN